MSECESPDHLFWRWQRRSEEKTFTVSELKTVHEWARIHFPASIDLIEFDLWCLQRSQTPKRRASHSFRPKHQDMETV
jgi:hypothetical protein